MMRDLFINRNRKVYRCEAHPSMKKLEEYITITIKLDLDILIVTIKLMTQLVIQIVTVSDSIYFSFLLWNLIRPVRNQRMMDCITRRGSKDQTSNWDQDLANCGAFGPQFHIIICMSIYYAPMCCYMTSRCFLFFCWKEKENYINLRVYDKKIIIDFCFCLKTLFLD